MDAERIVMIVAHGAQPGGPAPSLPLLTHLDALDAAEWLRGSLTTFGMLMSEGRATSSTLCSRIPDWKRWRRRRRLAGDRVFMTLRNVRDWFGFWSLGSIFVVLAIVEAAGAWSGFSHGSRLTPGAPAYFPWWMMFAALVIIMVQTSLIWLILGSNSEKWTVLRGVVAVAYTGAVLTLFGAQLLGEPSRKEPYLPVTPLFYALLLFVVSSVGLLLVLVRSARRAVR